MISDALNKRAVPVEGRRLNDSSDNDALKNSNREMLERKVKELEATLTRDVRDLKARNESLEIELQNARSRDHSLTYEIAQARESENELRVQLKQLTSQLQLQQEAPVIVRQQRASDEVIKERLHDQSVLYENLIKKLQAEVQEKENLLLSR